MVLWTDVVSDGPQGSVLGLDFFLIYMTYLTCFPIPVYYLLTTLKSTIILRVKMIHINCSRILLNWKSGLKCGRCLYIMFPSAKVYTWVELTPIMCIAHAWLAVTLNKPMKKET